MLFSRSKSSMVAPQDALPGRNEPGFTIPETHAVLGTRLQPPPAGLETAVFGLGCFWGAERKFWQTEGVYSTAAGYAGGFTSNPTYKEVCSGKTGDAEVVQVVAPHSAMTMTPGVVIRMTTTCRRRTDTATAATDYIAVKCPRTFPHPLTFPLPRCSTPCGRRSPLVA